MTGGGGAPSRRHRERVVEVELTEREARALLRATALVAELLRPELFRPGGRAVQSPLITAHQVLLAACERCGVEVGLHL